MQIKTLLETECSVIKCLQTTVSDLGYNYNTLRAKFWREYGISMQDYLVKSKLEKAKELLALDEFLIKQVAREIGYRDEATFVRQFKKIYGITPGMYQQRIQIENLVTYILQRVQKYI